MEKNNGIVYQVNTVKKHKLNLSYFASTRISDSFWHLSLSRRDLILYEEMVEK